MKDKIETLKAEIANLRELGYDNPLAATEDERLSLTARVELLARCYEAE